MEAPTSRSQRALRQAASRPSLVLVEAPPLASPMNGRLSPRAPPPSRTLAGSAGGPGGPRGALERAEGEAAVRPETPETPEDDEDEEEALPHSEAVDVFQEGLAMVVQDPLLCDLPIQVTLEEVNSQIALEYGQAMTVRVCKMDGEIMPVVVVQNATVLDLKKAIQRYVQLRQEREGGIQHISWSYVWRTYYLISAGEKLTEDRKKLRDYGIRNRDEVSFIKKLRQK
ncbi:U11/U12 small nuclear ribonucleoprotein 25 kDa protein [Hyaena hyaena]|nr:U11/U12 small nuclear ribonucleoprotein 25 kDa protein [Hyaena hyaena]